MTTRRQPRDETVERAVNNALARLDEFRAGAIIELPEPKYRQACDDLFFGSGTARKKSASVKTAILFLMFYWLEEPGWSVDKPPKAWRGEYGDKLLCKGLTQ